MLIMLVFFLYNNSNVKKLPVIKNCTICAAQLTVFITEHFQVFFFMDITFEKKIFHLFRHWPFLHISPSKGGMFCKQLVVHVSTISTEKLHAGFAVEISHCIQFLVFAGRAREVLDKVTSLVNGGL